MFQGQIPHANLSSLMQAQMQYIEQLQGGVEWPRLKAAQIIQSIGYSQYSLFDLVSKGIEDPKLRVKVGLILLRSSYVRDRQLSLYRSRIETLRSSIAFEAAASISGIYGDASTVTPEPMVQFCYRNWTLGAAKRLLVDSFAQCDPAILADGAEIVPALRADFLPMILTSEAEYEAYRVTDAFTFEQAQDGLWVPGLPKRMATSLSASISRTNGDIDTLISAFEGGALKSKVKDHLDRPTIRIALHAMDLTQNSTAEALHAALANFGDRGHELVAAVILRGKTYGITNRAGSVFNATDAPPSQCLDLAVAAQKAWKRQKRVSPSKGDPTWWTPSEVPLGSKGQGTVAAHRLDVWDRWFQFLSQQGFQVPVAHWAKP